MADLQRQRRDRAGAEGHRLSGVRGAGGSDQTLSEGKGGDAPGLEQKVGCAARAATRTQTAGASGLADLPSMRKLFVRAGRGRSAVR